ncbi:hypothetical protein GYMLUDRAFT_65384 [Collybiopsis luxurians FD-317 M1]|uniref:Uncharacterized protein n=1 Tax=Collybiopsis luxurians FD-317 M1 TaxID=944289 RepID=A0A0D0BXG9_9AGAR|nr:hypothetical protein GYMLUDRAFT_65384 [Collybiopsis luxurians FD-317 M1]
MPKVTPRLSSRNSSMRSHSPSPFRMLPVSLTGPGVLQLAISSESETFGLYFGLEYLGPQARQFMSRISTLPQTGRVKHSVAFTSVFSAEFVQDPVFSSLVVVDGRRYVIAGSYNMALSDTNISIGGIGCAEAYAGDLAILFLPKYDHSRLLKGLPRFRNANERNQALQRVISVY